jgi:hypothetical protein
MLPIAALAPWHARRSLQPGGGPARIAWRQYQARLHGGAGNRLGKRQRRRGMGDGEQGDGKAGKGWGCGHDGVGNPTLARCV